MRTSAPALTGVDVVFFAAGIDFNRDFGIVLDLLMEIQYRCGFMHLSFGRLNSVWGLALDGCILVCETATQSLILHPFIQKAPCT